MYCSEEWGKVYISQKEESPLSRFLSAKRTREEARNHQLTPLSFLILAKSFYPGGKWLAAHLNLTHLPCCFCAGEWRKWLPTTIAWMSCHWRTKQCMYLWQKLVRHHPVYLTLEYITYSLPSGDSSLPTVLLSHSFTLKSFQNLIPTWDTQEIKHGRFWRQLVESGGCPHWFSIIVLYPVVLPLCRSNIQHGNPVWETFRMELSSREYELSLTSREAANAHLFWKSGCFHGIPCKYKHL